MAKKSATELKQEELEFGIEEAVSVLMAKYRANVQTEINNRNNVYKEIDNEYDDEVERVKKSIDVDQYNTTSEVLGIRSRVADVEVNVGNTVEDSNVRVVLMLTDLDIVGSNYTPEFGKYRNLKLNKDDYEKLTEVNKRRSEAEDNVSEAENMMYDTNVEALVRAKVMEVRLTEMGMATLLNDEEVIDLITV